MTALVLWMFGVGGLAWGGGDIIYGEGFSEGHYPAAGGMLVGTVVSLGGSEYDLKMLMCSSTLIAPDVVLTAAHCVDFSYYEQMAGMEFDDVDIVFSRHADLSEYNGQPGTSWPTDAVYSWEAVPHPGFSMSTMGIGLSENDDIALLFLEDAILSIDPAVLPTRVEAEALVEGAEVDIVGWGQQTSDQVPPTGTSMYKMGGSSVIGEVADFEFQVGPDSDDVRKCHGDSGGPTYMDVGGGEIRLIGVTSHSYDMTDCRETGGVDTRVDYYLDWIDEEMRSRCEDGTRVWCETDGIVPPGFGGASSDLDEEGDVKVTGCGCSQAASSHSLGWIGFLLGLLVVRRR